MSLVFAKHIIDWEHASWQDGCTAVEQFTDRLGSSIDEGVFETVVVLNLIGLRTFQSCEGHLDHGCPYPWVDVIDAERFNRHTNMWIQVCKLEEQAKATKTIDSCNQYLSVQTHLCTLIARWEAEDPLFRQLIDLLDTFYVNQPIENPTRLLVKRHEPGMYRIAPGLSNVAKDIPEAFKAVYLAHGQADMQAFTAYLKRRWQKQRDGVTDISGISSVF